MENNKEVILEMPEYINFFIAGERTYVNTKTAKKWEEHGISIEGVLTSKELTKEEYRQDIKNFNYAEMGTAFTKTRNNALGFILDLLRLEEQFA